LMDRLGLVIPAVRKGVGKETTQFCGNHEAGCTNLE
jgi:hypothetical protein